MDDWEQGSSVALVGGFCGTLFQPLIKQVADRGVPVVTVVGERFVVDCIEQLLVQFDLNRFEIQKRFVH